MSVLLCTDMSRAWSSLPNSEPSDETPSNDLDIAPAASSGAVDQVWTPPHTDGHGNPFSQRMPLEVMELIGTHIDKVHVTGMWNRVLALRHNIHERREGHVRKFSSVVPMIGRSILEGDTAANPTPLLCNLISNVKRNVRPVDRHTLNKVYKKFPDAMNYIDPLWDETILHTATRWSKTPGYILDALKQNSSDVFDDAMLLRLEESFQTPLHCAVESKQKLEILERLIDSNGVVFSLVDMFKHTLIHTHLSCYRHNHRNPTNPKMNVFNMIMEKSVALGLWSQILQTQDYREQVPLHILCDFMNNVNSGDMHFMMQNLIDPAQNVLRMKNFEQNTPLHMALYRKAGIEVIAQLINDTKTVLSLRNVYDLEDDVAHDIPLCVAIKKGYGLDVIRRLVDDVSLVLLIESRFNELPVHTALRNIKEHKVTELNSGEDVACYLIECAHAHHQNYFIRCGRYGDTPLHCAIKFGASIDIVKKLIAVGPQAVSICNEETLDFGMYSETQQDTPLHLEIRLQYEHGAGDTTEFIQAMVEADPGVLQKTNQNGSTPLYLAINCGMSIEIIKYLYDADPSAILIRNQTHILKGAKAPEFFLPIHIALRRRYCLDVIKLLAGENRELLAMDHGTTLLHIALQWMLSRDTPSDQQEAQNETIKFLLLGPIGDSEDIRLVRNNKDYTPLHVSIVYYRNSCDFIELLIDKNETVLTNDNLLRKTPLHFALENKLPFEAIALLIPADPIRRKRLMSTFDSMLTKQLPIHYAARYCNDVRVFRRILGNGVYGLNMEDISCDRAIDIAVERHASCDVVQLLRPRGELWNTRRFAYNT